jgi:hypothetical protein
MTHYSCISKKSLSRAFNLQTPHISATTYLQMRPLARAIQQLEWRILKNRDSVVERSEFELAVPIFEQPDDSWLLRSPTP